MIEFRQKGDFSKLNNFLEKSRESINIGLLNKYGRDGVKALSSQTPVDTGLTAESWYYKITRTKGRATLSFHNRNVVNGVPIAIVIQYGHATRNGGWVDGIDYLNPAIQPIFMKIANEAWKEVKTR